MSVVPSDPTFDTRDSLANVQLRLVEASADLMRPLSSPADISERIQTVAAELDDIRQSLLLVYHVMQSEEDGLFDQLADIDRRLGEGWVPQGRPIEAVLGRLSPVAEDPESFTP